MEGHTKIKVKVEPCSTFTVTRGPSYIASISFMGANFTCVRSATVEINP